MTQAPASASVVAVASPMPAAEPETRAILPWRVSGGVEALGDSEELGLQLAAGPASRLAWLALEAFAAWVAVSLLLFPKLNNPQFGQTTCRSLIAASRLEWWSP